MNPFSQAEIRMFDAAHRTDTEDQTMDIAHVQTAVLRIRTRQARRAGAAAVTSINGAEYGSVAECEAELAARDAAAPTFRDTWSSGTGATHI